MVDVREYVCAYLRQQSELEMPDLIFATGLDWLLPHEKEPTPAAVPVNSKSPVAQLPPRATTPAQPQDAAIISAPSHAVKAPIKTARNGPLTTFGAIELDPVVPLASSKRDKLKDLFLQSKKCCCCDRSKTRSRVVFGAGNAEASLLVIGLEPGNEEESSGVPFTGRGGQLLADMLKAIKIDKKDGAFVTTILKCKSGASQPNATGCIEACLPILKSQIEIIKPRAIFLLGTGAAETLLKCSGPMHTLREQPHYWGSIPVVVSYLPDELLADPSLKRSAWIDLQRLQTLLTAEK